LSNATLPYPISRRTRSLATAAVLGLAALCWILPAAAAAQNETRDGGSSGDGGSSVSFRGGIGFTADPGAFLMSVGFPVGLTDTIALNPDMMFAVDDDDLIISPGLDLELRLGAFLDSQDENLRRLVPLVQLGAGLAYIEKDQHRSADEDGVGFVLRAGLGAEYEVSKGTYLGSLMRFNVLPVKTADERFFFSWDLISLRFNFP